LLNVSPLGWIERLQPMYGSRPLWLLPIGLFIAGLIALSIWLAGKRDLGAATFADKDSARPHSWLLSTPLRAAFRLNRSATLGWLLALGLTAFFYGLLSKGAAQAFSQSAKAERYITRLVPNSVRVSEITAFMGITFFLIMILAMFYAASAAGRVREDEAQGYIDNFLVRPVSRMRWLWGRILLFFSVVVAAGLLTSLATWAGEASQHGGIAIHSLLLAGVNAMVPVLFIFSVGIFALGFIPRLTSIFTYAVVGWSFLVAMLASGLNLNHWLLDSSLLHQIVLAPASHANWAVDVVVVGLGLLLCIIGSLRFNDRDLQNE
jgi:ABC-2 type transport system permease protein